MIEPKKGDVVEVIYRGEVEAVSGHATSGNTTGIRVSGAWHYPYNRAVTEVNIIEPALQVGWHRVKGPGDGVVARHWDGERWGQTEDKHPTLRDYWTSIQFLGGWNQ